MKVEYNTLSTFIHTTMEGHNSSHDSSYSTARKMYDGCIAILRDSGRYSDFEGAFMKFADFADSLKDEHHDDQAAAEISKFIAALYLSDPFQQTKMFLDHHIRERMKDVIEQTMTHVKDVCLAFCRQRNRVEVWNNIFNEYKIFDLCQEVLDVNTIEVAFTETLRFILTNDPEEEVLCITMESLAMITRVFDENSVCNASSYKVLEAGLKAVAILKMAARKYPLLDLQVQQLTDFMIETIDVGALTEDPNFKKLTEGVKILNLRPHYL